MAKDTQSVNVPTDVDLSPSPSRMKLGAMSFPSLKIQSGEIYEEARRELRYPQCISIYQQMSLEPTISSALALLEILISRPEWEVKVKENAPQEEKDRAEFVNWCLSNMERPWEDYIIEFLGYLTYGHQPVEKIYKKIGKGKYAGKLAISDLRPISPTTISKWLFSLKTGHIVGLRQDLGKFSSDFSRGAIMQNKSATINDIPRNKFMLFRYNAKLDNPQGTSPLRSCYLSWKQKAIVEDYELIGLSRDLGGTPIIGVDVDFLAKASDPDSNEYTILQEMKMQAANLHAGDQNYIMKPIAYNDQGKELFSFELVGVQGGGKQYDPDLIVKRKENNMLMAFLADVLKLGTESHGSFSLADAKTSLLVMGIEHHLKIIRNALNHDLIKQIYAVNGWEYKDGVSGKFEYSDVENRELDILSKYIQRCVSVGAIRQSKELEDFLLDTLGMDQKESGEYELLDTISTSRAGESNGTSGTGANAQSNSDSNNDNAA